jgi:hypothetical protein
MFREIAPLIPETTAFLMPDGEVLYEIPVRNVSALKRYGRGSRRELPRPAQKRVLTGY